MFVATSAQTTTEHDARQCALARIVRHRGRRMRA